MSLGEETADWVDHFVVVEADQTFAGAPKPLCFKDHEATLEVFGSKITHISVAVPEDLNTHWARDSFRGTARSASCRISAARMTMC